MCKNFVPLHDKVLIKRLDPEEKTTGGLFIPDSAKEKPVKGKVVAVGNGKINENGTIVPFTIKAGDIVLFNKWGGTEIKIDNEDYIVMKESDIIGIYLS